MTEAKAACGRSILVIHTNVNISETAFPIRPVSYEGETKHCSTGHGHITKMATVSTYGKSKKISNEQDLLNGHRKFNEWKKLMTLVLM